MGASVDWLDVLKRYGAEAVVRGVFVAAEPAKVLPAKKTRARKGAVAAEEEDGGDGGDGGHGGAPFSSSASPDPVMRQGEDGSTDGRAGVAAERDDDLICWGGGVMDKEEAIERDVLVRSDMLLPDYLARKVAVRKFMPPARERRESCFTIARYGGGWWRRPTRAASAARWKQVDEELLAADVTADLCQLWKEAPTKENRNKIETLVTASTRSLTENVLKSLVGYVHVPADMTMPVWLPAAFDALGRPMWEMADDVEDQCQAEASPYRGLDGRPLLAKDLLPLRDGLLDVAAWCDTSKTIRERWRLLPHTPRYFNRAILPHAIDVDALAAAEDAGEERLHDYVRGLAPTWASYLEDVSYGDPDWQLKADEILADMMSYTRVGQYIHWLQGDSGAGKTTFVECGVRAVVGGSNMSVCDPEQLTGRFALTALVGRLAYVINEFRIDAHTRVAALVNFLLSASGGGTFNVEEKYRSASSMVDISLPGRFLITCNLDPRLREAEALVRRLNVLPFRAPRRRADVDLWDKLKGEGSGIFLRALMALPGLRERKRFTQVALADQMLAEIHRNISPVHAFVMDTCVVGEEHAVETTILRELFYAWCEDQGDEKSEQYFTEQVFGAKLKGCGLNISRDPVQRRDGLSWRGAKAYRLYRGVRPRYAGEAVGTPLGGKTVTHWDAQLLPRPKNDDEGSGLPYTT